MCAHLPRTVVLGLLLLAMSTGAAAQTVPRYEVVHRFDWNQGSYPHGFLIQGSDGALYGTFRWGPAMVFRMTLDGTLTVLANQSPAAYEPWAGLVQGLDGAFYGTTYYGGPADAGTIFRVTTSGDFTVLHTFTSTGQGSSDGRHPRAALIQSPDGMLYGTTADGGTGDAGVVFQITPDGRYTTLRSFPRQEGGGDAGPRSALLRIAGDPDGLYGTVRSGGRYGIGTRGFGAIFKTTISDPDASSAPVVLHDFEGAPNDGADPGGALIQAPDGNFYSTTYLGGAVGGEWGNGTVFKATPLGVVTILHSFAGGPDDGSAPQGGVILARDGNFYGSTHDGGVYNLGVVYRMTPSGEVTVLHSFARGSDGASPYAGLVEASDGTLYGMTAGGGGGGGDVGAGTIFRIRFVSTAPVTGFDGDAAADMPLYDASTGTWRILTSSSGYRSSQQIFWGGPEYTPVPADYDGDGRLDVAVYHAGRGIWYVLTSSSNFTSVIMRTLGGVGDAPAPGDFDGDGRADPAVYRRTTGQWTILKSGDNATLTLTVAPGGVPIRGDFDGDSVADPAIYVPATGAWRVLTSSSNFTTVVLTTLGGPGFAPVPGDYDGDRKTDMAVYNGATGDWKVRQSSTSVIVMTGWGGTGYTPVPGDYDGDGKSDLAVYSAAAGEWFVLQSSSGLTTTLRAVWGTPIESVVTMLPVATAWTDALRATDFDGDGASDIAVYEPSTGTWSILTSSSHFTITRTITGSAVGQTPLPGDYDGDGLTDPATFDPSTGIWSLPRTTAGALSVTLGDPGDLPVPRDYDGDGITDVAVYTPWTGAWRIKPSSWSSSFADTRTVNYGSAWWSPVPADYDGDGLTDLGLYDRITGHWQVLLATSNYSTPQLTMAWGGGLYTPMPADFDGDGKADFGVCVKPAGQWYVLKSGFTYTTAFGVGWGEAIDTPRSADYDGDGISDMVSYDSATGEWYLRLSSSYFTLSLVRTLGGGIGFVLPRTP